MMFPLAARNAFFDEITELAVRHTPMYGAESVRWGFSRMFAHWRADEFECFFAREIPGMTQEAARAALEVWCDFGASDEARRRAGANPCARRVLRVTASTVPCASFQDAMLLLTMPVSVTIRPARQQALMFDAWRECLTRTFPALDSRIAIAPPTHEETELESLCRAHDLVIVSGSDETIARYRAMIDRIVPERRPALVAHGHRVSAMILMRGETLTQDRARQMALDLSLWDQSGCLSPRFLFAECSRDEIMEGAHRLADALDEVAINLPACAPDLCSRAQKNSALSMAELDGCLVLRAHQNGDAIVIHPEEAPFAPIFAPRTLNIYPVTDAIQAARALSPRAQALATARPLPPDAVEKLARAGYNYFCRFGAMQNPPLTWFHENVGTIAPLFESRTKST